VAQNQNVDARSSWTTVPSQCTIGFPPLTPEPTPANVQVNQVAGCRRRVAQNQNVDARPSRTTVPSQRTMGFPPPTPEPTPANVQVNQVAGPSRLPLTPLQHIAPCSFLAAPVSTILCG
jgi:hypothetical protein